MLRQLRDQVGGAIADALREAHGIEAAPTLEVPPRRELGDLACPTALHLAKALKKAPRQIATEAVEKLVLPEGVLEVRVEGPGYLNFFLNRPHFAAGLLAAETLLPASEGLPKVVVEHTNINPNKAAHIGHLRNAILGDILVSCLRAIGHPTEIQNYIDDTGVQVADVVVGFIDLRGLDIDQVRAIEEPFDYYCWDLYAEVGRWFEDNPDKQQLRRDTLHELESGEGDRAEMGRLVARRIVERHLATMKRLGIDYDVLTRESEILRLDFFASAFDQLAETGAIKKEEEGKNKGCWVMPLADNEEFQGLEEPDKVIVRSDGTVTYVGKDIAYQLWKFGLLGKDFEYRHWDESGELWETNHPAEENSPSFGGAKRVINVIDARQSYLQKIVRAGLEALNHSEEAEQSIHFAYEMVSLSKQTAIDLGFLSQDDEEGKSLEMSGRKGIGVKADDLIDQLIATSKKELEQRNPELPAEELAEVARKIAVAALRYHMAKATTTRVIAFDLAEALDFQGDSGPYLQYSWVRARNIQRKLDEAGLATTVEPAVIADSSADHWQDDLWDLALHVAQIELVVERATETLELSMVARHASDLSQKFHSVYHKHPILREENEGLRNVRLGATQIFQRGLVALTELLGVPVPDRM